MQNFPAFERIAGAGPLVLICDHASSATPPSYGNLGLPQAAFARHIAYDIGAAGVTRRLAALLGAPAVLSTFSRLLIDPNRGADDPTLVMRISDGAIVPGNATVDAAETDARIARFWRPYREAIAAELRAVAAAGAVPVVVSVHTFTPVWRNVARPWQAGVLWDRDDRLARPLIAALRADGLVCGDNEPYDGALKGDTMYDLCTAAGIAHALVEIRQDLVSEEAGQAAWAERLARLLGPLLADPALGERRFFGSRADGRDGGFK
ncbi:MAG: N-formylglutamate amidohydrolase [Hyphomicrobiales bacterium]|nr:N-formylglutamate amidohydrolase [Hyphomicrobiales bacterium]